MLTRFSGILRAVSWLLEGVQLYLGGNTLQAELLPGPGSRVFQLSRQFLFRFPTGMARFGYEHYKASCVFRIW